jgi:CSLREA domain-containing protein
MSLGKWWLHRMRRPSRQSNPSRCRPQVQALEDRLLLTITVNSTGDAPNGVHPFPLCDTGNFFLGPPVQNNLTGICTLRAAIQTANLAGGGVINFNLPAGSTIFPGSALDEIVVPVTIDGSGPDGKPGIVLDGSNADPHGQGVDGLVIAGGNSTVKGLVIDNFKGVALAGGVVLGGAALRLHGVLGDNVVQGNYLGTDLTGLVARPNGFGLIIGALGGGGSGDNTVGGTTVQALNLISGNTYAGLEIIGGPNSTNNVVEGNYIGTDLTGLAALANQQSGIYITNGAGQTRIGANANDANAAAEGNVISGNKQEGVLISGSDDNVVAGNYIGVDATGMARLGNGREGVRIDSGSSNNTVGGTTEVARNILSSNLSGVSLRDDGTTGNLVSGNYIGTDAGGTVKLGNNIGVYINNAADNTIGGTMAGAGNLISGNFDDGVQLVDAGATRNVIAGNFIGTDRDGAATLGNGFEGVDVIAAPGNTIGGSDPGAANLISGNAFDGVFVGGAGADGNVVAGNLIGTDITGTVALANGGDGVLVSNGADNTIGGLDPLAPNLISGNLGDGIGISGAKATNNLVAGNLVGTDITGKEKLGNAGDGVHIVNGASENAIGNGAEGPGNLLSGNGRDGVFLGGAGTALNLVQGNLIGTDITGGAELGNAGVGVVLANHATGNTIGGLGGPVELGNVISGNGSDGVRITDNFTTLNLVQGNFIGTDQAGTIALGNLGNGVSILNGAATNAVGGAGVPVAGLGNLISGNTGDGVLVSDNGTTENQVQGNLIGTDITGAARLANTSNGVEIVSGANANLIGGAGAPGGAGALGNVISGSGQDGVRLSDNNTARNLVQGNFIGTNLAGVAALANAAHGVEIVNGANGNTIGGVGAPLAGLGNVIAGNARDGVHIVGAGTSNNVVQTNFIGTDATGAAALANGNDGVLIGAGAASNTVGGIAAGAGNIVSGNVANGVELTGNGTAQNLVQGNRIGTDVTGGAAVANRGDGVLIGGGATSNTIGGIAAGNVLSGNSTNGVEVTGVGTTQNQVQGNLIGTDAAGAAAVANVRDGVLIGAGAASNTVGGIVAGMGNILSGNTRHGVEINNAGSNVVAGNLIGTDAAGAAALGNGGNGVALAFGAANNTIGGLAAGAANTIGASTSYGVSLFAAGTSGNLIAANYIGTNAAGAAILGNRSGGVAITGGAADNTVGAPGAGNVISGNTASGVLLTDAGTSGNLVQSNRIGTNPAGTAALANTVDGVRIINGAADNTIGGIGTGNTISGNGRHGVFLTDPGTTGNLVQSNQIGTNSAGTAAVANSADGVRIVNGAAANTIGGIGASNTISGNGGYGAFLTGAGTSANLIQGNRIGTTADGSALLPNNNDGVRIAGSATNNTVGGAALGAGNLVSGNNGSGVSLSGVGTRGNLVQGNLIGTDGTGQNGLGNVFNGVQIDSGADSNVIGGPAAGAGNNIAFNLNDGVSILGAGTRANVVQGNLIVANASDGVALSGKTINNAIGGTAPSQRNVLSGNTRYGVLIRDAGTNGNTVLGNFIGTNALGTAAYGNQAGVVLQLSATGNTIGGTAVGAGNVISANVTGVVISDLGTSANLVQGNLIGSGVNGAALPNVRDGVAVFNNASGNLIGGTVSGAGNTIRFNGRNGVLIGSDPANGIPTLAGTGNSVRGNVIANNGRLAIDLGPDDGVTLNDSAGHVGPNDYQNFPVLTSAVATGTSTTITGTLSSKSLTPYDIDLFSNPSADPSGYGQGQTYLGAVHVMTDSAGHASFTFNIAEVLVSQFTSATATDGVVKDTSEYSLDFRLVAPVVKPPAVQSVVVNDGSAQRSMVESLSVTFTTQVDISPGAFTLVQSSNGSTGDISGVVSFTTALTADGRTVATLTFAGSGIVGGSLADGRYTLTVHSNLVHDHQSGLALAADSVNRFFRLFGDVNGDGKVDDTDRTAFLAAYRSRKGMANYRSYFDFNNDGAIDSVDYYQFQRRYGTQLM